MYCPNCRRLRWARREDNKWICTECGNEITYSEKNISSEQHDGVSPEVKRTGT